MTHKEYVFHPASARGTFQNDWLQSAFSFSFADYFDPEKMGFGALRVINDDIINARSGFPLHPHRNMEIITIPLRGQLEHRDSTGGTSILTLGQIQLMSAGSGIRHSEMNPASDEDVELFQIWIIPNELNTAPSYQTQALDLTKPGLVTIASPNRNNGLFIRQNAIVTWANPPLDEEIQIKRSIGTNGLYFLVVEGALTVDGHKLHRRDAIGIIGGDCVMKAHQPGTRCLIFDVPATSQ